MYSKKPLTPATYIKTLFIQNSGYFFILLTKALIFLHHSSESEREKLALNTPFCEVLLLTLFLLSFLLSAQSIVLKMCICDSLHRAHIYQQYSLFIPLSYCQPSITVITPLDFLPPSSSMMLLTTLQLCRGIFSPCFDMHADEEKFFVVCCRRSLFF